MSNPFAVVYRFEVKSGKEEAFIEAWSEMTHLIHQHEGSLGSRLHKTSDGLFVAYALWPDENTFKNAGSKLPEKAAKYRQIMRDTCESIHTEHEMTIVQDLLLG